MSKASSSALLFFATHSCYLEATPFFIRQLIVHAAEICSELLRFFVVRLKLNFLLIQHLELIICSLDSPGSNIFSIAFFAFLIFLPFLLYFFSCRRAFLGRPVISQFAVLRSSDTGGFEGCRKTQFCQSVQMSSESRVLCESHPAGQSHVQT